MPSVECFLAAWLRELIASFWTKRTLPGLSAAGSNEINSVTSDSRFEVSAEVAFITGTGKARPLGLVPCNKGVKASF